MSDPWPDTPDNFDPSDYDSSSDQTDSYDYRDASAGTDPVDFADVDHDHAADSDQDARQHDDADYSPQDADPRWDELAGHPAEAAAHWHEQERDDTGAVACQQFVLEDLTGHAPGEAELSALAEDLGWQVPGGGTPLYDTGHLLEHFGLAVSERHGGQLADLEVALDQGLDVIIALSDYQTLHVNTGLDLDTFPGIPGQEPEHAVQVIGVDLGGDAAGGFVIVNDPTHQGGRGLEIPVADFLECWSSSGNYLLLAGGRSDA